MEKSRPFGIEHGEGTSLVFGEGVIERCGRTDGCDRSGRMRTGGAAADDDDVVLLPLGGGGPEALQLLFPRGESGPATPSKRKNGGG